MMLLMYLMFIIAMNNKLNYSRYIITFNSYYLEMVAIIFEFNWKQYVSSTTYIKLKEENKKLKEELDKFSEAYKRYRDYEKEELSESCYDFARENDKLKEEKKVLLDKVKQLEERLDNKEKVNKQLREDIGKLVMKQ